MALKKLSASIWVGAVASSLVVFFPYLRKIMSAPVHRIDESSLSHTQLKTLKALTSLQMMMIHGFMMANMS
jgi:uncharacterized protein (DUF486 family)